jgi:hypothetical protein
MKDEGRPLGPGLQDLGSNQRMRLWLKALVVSDTLKVSLNWQVTVQKVTARESLMRYRNVAKTMSKPDSAFNLGQI